MTKQSHERRIVMIISRNFKRGFVLLFIVGLVLQMAVARTQRESASAKKGSINPALFGQ